MKWKHLHTQLDSNQIKYLDKIQLSFFALTQQIFNKIISILWLYYNLWYNL